MSESEFEKYARGHCGISSLRLHDYRSIAASYVSPTIIEERQLNVATMDVFSRLMMDRIIFLEDGRVTAIGPHSELYETCPAYHRMVELQKLEEEGAKHNA